MLGIDLRSLMSVLGMLLETCTSGWQPGGMVSLEKAAKSGPGGIACLVGTLWTGALACMPYIARSFRGGIMWMVSALLLCRRSCWLSMVESARPSITRA